MGDNLPSVGERVVYNRTETDSVFATVIRVTYWDLVDLELECGVRLSDVRRVVTFVDEGIVIRECVVGRFERLVPDDYF